MVGARELSGQQAREKIFTMRTDLDHPTNQQVSKGPQVAERTKARAKK